MPLGGQPWISERKSWRGHVITEQGNPGIYVQIDEWQPLYKGNIYVVDEVMGRMYLSKGEHIMRIAETMSHCPFQDHELSITRHVPKREQPHQEEQIPSEVQEPKLTKKRGEMAGPLTPIAGMVGEVGRTPVPVAESTRQPGEKSFTPGEAYRGQSSDLGGIHPIHDQRRRAHGVQEEGEPEWPLLRPSEPHGPPGEGTVESKVLSQMSREQEEKLPKQGPPASGQRLVKADKWCRKRLETLARDHIMKLREDRQRLEGDWLEEYSMQATSARVNRTSLDMLWAEYFHWYNKLLDHEQQPHSDFFINLSLDMEDELDLDEEK